MRALLFFVAATTAMAAHAETNFFSAERGHWFVGTVGKACRALNRPPADFNASPFNALEIVLRPGNAIAAEVYFWPGAIDPKRDYVLNLAFTLGDTFRLKAKSSMGDFMLASEPDVKLWRSLQDATALVVTVDGEPKLELYFGLDDMNWVLRMLQSCADTLPKE